MSSVPHATPTTLPEIRGGSDGGAGDERFPWDSHDSRVLHPLQVIILEALIRTGQPISPVDVTRMCDGEHALALLGYHTKALADRGVIEVVETEPVRGTIRHLYALVPESRWP
jgi:hypothetical protein